MTGVKALFEILAMLNYEQVDECDKKDLLRTIKQDLDRLEQLEKELKQTKLNFKNSQSHSKNCYKKLKEKYNEVKYCYEKLSKDHMSLKISFDELFEVYIRVRRELEQLEKENTKLKQAIKILKEKLELKLEVYRNGGCTLNHKVIHNCITSDERCLRYLEIKDYELLKQVFESVGE